MEHEEHFHREWSFGVSSLEDLQPITENTVV